MTRTVLLTTTMFLVAFGSAGGVSAQRTGAPKPPVEYVSKWNFDEGSGELAKDANAKSGNDAKKGKLQWVEGISGKALLFPGGRSGVQISNNKSLCPEEGITLSVWVKPAVTIDEDTKQIYSLFSKGTSANGNGINLWLHSQGKLFFQVSSDMDSKGKPKPLQYHNVLKQVTLEKDRWYHVAATHDKQDVKVYLNGNLVGKAFGECKLGWPDLGLTIGGYPSTNWGFHGAMDEPAIYNRPLSAGEIRNIYEEHAATASLTDVSGQRKGAPKPPVIYVSADGSGDFNCDGQNDHVEINRALDYAAANTRFTTVHLKGPNTYWISDTIYISSNTVLEGDAGAVIKLVDKANWRTKFKPLLGQKGTEFAGSLGDLGTSTRNITIRGFEIDGNVGAQSEPDGDSYYTMIQLQNCYNVTINDMYLHDNRNDAIRFVNDKPGSEVNSKFYNNRIHRTGHDGLYLINLNKFEVFNNHITRCRTDAGVRPQQCNKFKIYGNTIGNSLSKVPSGGAAIQIESARGVAVIDAEVYDNFLYGFGWYGIWLNANRGSAPLGTYKDVRIHHNIILSCQKGGIGIEGFHNTLIEHNVIDGNNLGGVLFTDGDPGGRVSGFKTSVRNNTITNTKRGYGLDNRKPAIHSFHLTRNRVHGNTSGHYNNASSTSDIHAGPPFSPAKARSHIVTGWQRAKKKGDFRGDLGERAAKRVLGLKSASGQRSKQGEQ